MNIKDRIIQRFYGCGDEIYRGTITTVTPRDSQVDITYCTERHSEHRPIGDFSIVISREVAQNIFLAEAAPGQSIDVHVAPTGTVREVKIGRRTVLDRRVLDSSSDANPSYGRLALRFE